MQNNEFKYCRCLIIGNGFDLNMKLPTSYEFFLKSDEWKDLVKKYRKVEGLIAFIIKQHSINNWCDLESMMLEYAKQFKDNKSIEVDVIREEFTYINDVLSNYLTAVIRKNTPSIDCFANFFLRKYLLMSNENPIFSFNYTPLELFADYYGITNFPRVTYIHGSIENKNSILGIECDNINDIAPELSFMLKSNSVNYHSIDVYESLMASEYVYIFGHSLNLIDKNYFETFFTKCIDEQIRKNIVFITKDEESDRGIRDNIRKMGLSLTKLFLFSNVRFLHADKLDALDDDEKGKVIAELEN